MPSLNVLRNVNLAIETRQGPPCPNPALNPIASCGANELTYTVLSLDEENQKWYPTNEFGRYTPDTGSTYGIITGSAQVINVNENGCNYPGVYFSGSAVFPIDGTSIYIGIVTGSFLLSGLNEYDTLQSWTLYVDYKQTGSIIPVGYRIDDATSKNAIVGMELGTYFPSSQKTAMEIYVSGSNIAGNPPDVAGAPWNFAPIFTLQGEGIIRTFGTNTAGTLSQQTQYNCLYGSTPSK